MSEARHIPTVRWAEMLRRERCERRRTRLRVAGTAIAAVAATAAAAGLIWPPRPALVWNMSESSPIGLYRVSSGGQIRVGDMALTWPPAAIRALAAQRHYLPSNVPLVKKVAAARGDRVCAAGEAVFINGEFAALRLSEDSSGRPLPSWTGCKDLATGELFLMGSGGDSFDGRYFGVTRPDDVLGRARRLWPR